MLYHNNYSNSPKNGYIVINDTDTQTYRLRQTHRQTGRQAVYTEAERDTAAARLAAMQSHKVICKHKN